MNIDYNPSATPLNRLSDEYFINRSPSTKNRIEEFLGNYFPYTQQNQDTETCFTYLNNKSFELVAPLRIRRANIPLLLSQKITLKYFYTTNRHRFLCSNHKQGEFKIDNYWQTIKPKQALVARNNSNSNFSLLKQAKLNIESKNLVAIFALYQLILFMFIKIWKNSEDEMKKI